MTLKDKINKFNNWKDRLSAYGLALTMLGVDQTFGSPVKGAEYRMSRTAILRGEYVRVLQDEEMYGIIGDLIKEPEGSFEEFLTDSPMDEGDIRRELELYYRSLTKDRDIPPEKYMEFSKALDRSKTAWLEAKTSEDFRGYVPYLDAVIKGYKELTALADSPLGLYDRMLDDNQPGWTKAQYDVFFGHVKERVVPMVKEAASYPEPDKSFMNFEFGDAGQRRVMNKILNFIGFTPDWGKMGESEHPLTTSLSQGDVRFTTKFRKHDISQAVLSSVHESGHAWFGHNVDPKYDGSIIGRSISAGLHESQSRLCENHLGRSFAFWEQVYPWFKEEFPEELKGTDLDSFYRLISHSRPSLIRTESDELTYPLHILIRYELEKEMMEGGLEAADLEEAWNSKYEEYLGIRPGKPSEGILQDMHWPYAYFGYFPTYALGSAMAAQFYGAMKRDIDPEALIRSGKYTEIMGWLREHVHKYANRYPAEKVLEMATGEPFNDEYYFNWLKERYIK